MDRITDFFAFAAGNVYVWKDFLSFSMDCFPDELTVEDRDSLLSARKHIIDLSTTILEKSHERLAAVVPTIGRVYTGINPTSHEFPDSIWAYKKLSPDRGDYGIYFSLDPDKDRIIKLFATLYDPQGVTAGRLQKGPEEAEVEPSHRYYGCAYSDGLTISAEADIHELAQQAAQLAVTLIEKRNRRSRIGSGPDACPQ